MNFQKKRQKTVFVRYKVGNIMKNENMEIRQESSKSKKKYSYFRFNKSDENKLVIKSNSNDLKVQVILELSKFDMKNLKSFLETF